MIYLIYKYRLVISIPACILSCGIIAALMSILIIVVPKDDVPNDAIGYTAMVINIFLAVTPLQKFFDIIASHNATLIPIELNIVMIICSTCWLIYAIVFSNIPLLIPQVLVIVLSLINVAIYIVFRIKYGIPKEEEKAAEPISQNDPNSPSKGSEMKDSNVKNLEKPHENGEQSPNSPENNRV